MNVVVADGVVDGERDASEKREGWNAPGNSRDRFPHLWADVYCFRPGRIEQKAKRNGESNERGGKGRRKKKVVRDTRSGQTLPRAGVGGVCVLRDEGHAAV